ncbi:hypothetical protein FHN55_08620 [Streptomyces sp. NP160]|uniref:hypothetical protein n=1 Tax=Streptomyces sp. NP160 TaxID=2586637 RepID=UPI001119FFB6|nr:hypothetical protein [Streptomyces sp. NP160]TNM67870.1 hypothetical protein FHN55_08620 [Streptomyces sp. NP160]
MSETDPLSTELPAEVDPADLAEQQRSSAPSEDADELGGPLGDVEASEADVVEQRQAVPDADDDEESRA